MFTRGRLPHSSDAHRPGLNRRALEEPRRCSIRVIRNFAGYTAGGTAQPADGPRQAASRPASARHWRPKLKCPPIRFARFSEDRLAEDVERHVIDGVSVPIFGVARIIADLFRYQRTIGVNVALEGLRESLRQRRAQPAEIARQAAKAKGWKVMEPYVTALTADA